MSDTTKFLVYGFINDDEDIGFELLILTPTKFVSIEYSSNLDNETIISMTDVTSKESYERFKINCQKEYSEYSLDTALMLLEKTNDLVIKNLLSLIKDLTNFLAKQKEEEK